MKTYIKTATSLIASHRRVYRVQNRCGAKNIRATPEYLSATPQHSLKPNNNEQN